MTERQEKIAQRIAQANFPGPGKPELKDFENYLRKRDRLAAIDPELGTLYEKCFKNSRYDLGQELYRELCMTKVASVYSQSLGSTPEKGFPNTFPGEGAKFGM